VSIDYRIIPKESLHQLIDEILPFPTDITSADYSWGYPPLRLLAQYHQVPVKTYCNTDLEALPYDKANVEFIFDELFASNPFMQGEVIVFPICGRENTDIDALAVAACDLRAFLAHDYEELFGRLKLVYNSDADVAFVAPWEHRVASYHHSGYLMDIVGRKIPYIPCPLYPVRIGRHFVVDHPWIQQGDCNVYVWEKATGRDEIIRIITTLNHALGNGYNWGTSLPYIFKKVNQVFSRQELAQNPDYNCLLAQNIRHHDALRLQKALKELPCEVEIKPAFR